ncbi:MAG: adenosylmethionine--8-amino-7-oxononanoate transaminase [Planctomycetes bacterium]|nr:adenosylmethionine--8-amino-7-oxononanoate transaminase [Planctomycetota bacterium]
MARAERPRTGAKPKAESVDPLIERDRRAIWHPYAQHALEADPLPVASARDATLTLNDGRVVIDAISSWWATLHGHGRAEIASAIAVQAKRLDHVLFAGATHEPAVDVAEALLALAPPGLSRVFFSDDGSTAVEVALKMALQAHAQRGATRRTRFVAFSGAYHGDTAGAMSVGDPDPFFVPYRALCVPIEHVAVDAAALEATLKDLGETVAAVILEPLVQGAGGMRMHEPAFVKRARELCDEHGAFLILDEVMTGFGRTGATFAAVRCGVTPDLLCVAKGLTGGTLPLAATLATEHLFGAFLAEDRRKALFHGHTFTANPIACAAARASLAILAAEDTPARLDAIGTRIEARLRASLPDACVATLRRCGGIVAFDLPRADGEVAGYLASRSPALRQRALEYGVLLRPLGDVVYAMPPSCTTNEQCDVIADAMRALAK